MKEDKKTGKKSTKVAKKLSKISAETIKLVILALPLTVLIIKKIINHHFLLEDYFDTDIIVSFVFIFICESIASSLAKYWGKKIEDENKLTVDYKKLVGKYARTKLLECEGITLPFEVIYNQPNAKLILDETNYLKQYELPAQIKSNSSIIMKAHKYSTVYNNMTVRIDSVQYDKETNVATVKYSKTTYFDHLLTNRAMDYVCIDGKSIREIYEPGPFLGSLEESKMANQLGFNGFIELSDDKVIFVKRGNKVSTAKNLWSPSISASFKVKYGLDDSQKLTYEGISNAIIQEIKDELNISISENDSEMWKTIIGFYRDVVEGGKPHFVFRHKMENLDSDSFVKLFDELDKKKQEKEGIIDGTRIELLSIEELKKCKIEIDGIVVGEKKYHMNPSMLGTLIMTYKMRV